MAIASHPTFFSENYRIWLLHQNNPKNRIRYRIAEFDKKICDFFDYFGFFVFKSISFLCLVIS